MEKVQAIMETPLKFYVVPRAQIERWIAGSPIPSDYLSGYLSCRPDVLGDRTQDIFAPNSRSEKQRWTAFELFEQVHDSRDADFIVCQTWLELFEAGGVRQNIEAVMNEARLAYPEPIVWSWNHDRNEASVGELQKLPDNEFVISYNTSKPTPNDILVPFWNVSTAPAWEPETPRRFIAGFMGFVGNLPVRRRIFDAFNNRPRWYVYDAVQNPRFDEEIYLSQMQQFNFGLCPRGGGLSSYRLYEAIQCGAVPVIFGDDAALPYPDLRWGEFSIRIHESSSGDVHKVETLLYEFDHVPMRRRLSELRERFSLAGVQREIYQRIREFVDSE